MTFSIRSFATADLPALHAIRAAAFAPVFASFRAIVGPEIAALGLATAEAEQGQLLDSICATGSGHEVRVACVGEAIGGFVSWKLTPDQLTGEITLNAVHPDHGGKGIGAALYNLALAAMREAGMKLATVGTGGDPSHEPARRAYEKAGFGAAIPSLYMYRVL